MGIFISIYLYEGVRRFYKKEYEGFVKGGGGLKVLLERV